MPRPRNCKRVACDPSWVYFKPRGVPLRDLDEEIVPVEELEAFRLVDLEDLSQEETASRMGVSQPSVNRLVASARKKIASALVNGRAIRIEGGDYVIAKRKFLCYDCRNESEVPFGEPRPAKCPKCGSANLHRSSAERGFGARGRGRSGLRRGVRHGFGRGPPRKEEATE